MSDRNTCRVGEKVRIFLRGKTWWARFQANKRQHRLSLDTTKKKMAMQRAARLDGKLIAGEWKPAVEVTTVSTAIDAYLKMLRVEGRSAKTLTKYTHVLQRVAALAEKRGIRDLCGLDRRFLDDYRSSRHEAAAKPAPKTVYTELVIVRQLIRYAIDRNMLSTDPQKGVKFRKPKATPQPCWTREIVIRILDAAERNVKAPLTILAETGLRFGELAWLTWDDIDLENNLLHVRPKEGWQPKSGDQRVVPLSQLAKGTIRQLPRQWNWVVTMPPSSISSAEGRQWTERRLLASLKRILSDLELVGKLHTFRHSFISNALLANTPVATVRHWVGHVDQRVIDLYTHIHDQASQNAMANLEASNERNQVKDKSSPAEGTNSGEETSK